MSIKSKRDLELESALALVLRYEQCYEGIKAMLPCDTADLKNPLVYQIIERLDATFGSKGERT